jgi:hypothetical protein
MTVVVSWYILRRSFFATHRGPWLLLRSSHLILPVISTHFQRQASFSSMPDTLKGWGLSSSNMTFFRYEMRALLFRYINQGDAMIEYEWLAVYYDDFFFVLKFKWTPVARSLSWWSFYCKKSVSPTRGFWCLWLFFYMGIGFDMLNCQILVHSHNVSLL